VQRVAGRRRHGDPRRGDRRLDRRRLRAYAADGGEILWQFDTNRTYETVNGVPGTGASIDGSPLIVGGGMIFVNSGYGGIAARPGNVLLAFGVD
jgi:polyvinyl alcohol dehydrogenase (cytochrome)